MGMVDLYLGKGWGARAWYYLRGCFFFTWAFVFCSFVFSVFPFLND